MGKPNRQARRYSTLKRRRKSTRVLLPYPFNVSMMRSPVAQQQLPCWNLVDVMISSTLALTYELARPARAWFCRPLVATNWVVLQNPGRIDARVAPKLGPRAQNVLTAFHMETLARLIGLENREEEADPLAPGLTV
ncbi:uncharacterized protein PG986_003869 [Apiospora aurea]|uniref:Uncharacterized protein n=1 Tax=Apiospora aurea TaxID=335848 RepID=A0ABR1QKY4_9PEZI